LSAGLLKIADELGISESFCPVRAMLGAFVSGSHFPKPDLLFCSAGAICDDFSAIAQRLESLGFEINWWEIPNRREVESGEASVTLPCGFHAPISQFEIVKSEIKRIRQILEEKTGNKLNDKMLADGIRKSNQIRNKILKIRDLVFYSRPCPLPALELMIVEMLALHFCSDREECDNVLDELLSEVEKRVEANIGIADFEAVKVFWVNPVADLKVMNLLEESGFCLCGTDFMFRHALERIPEDLPPIDALALMALDDPMIGTIADRGKRISNEIKKYKPDAVIISRIPGASHCAFEGRIIGDIIHDNFQIPVLEIEVPPLSDAMSAGIRNKFQALHETVKASLQSKND
jgi:benzoyl-CoA reductase/2-hydroxyglutaryl-CoA dehydratase subunit BcrC/BadD/HgdB